MRDTGGQEISANHPVGARFDIEPVSCATDEVCALVAELDAELSGLYNPEQRHGLALDSLFQPHIRFFIARMNGMAIGCGGIALFSEYAEIKRMYVRNEARGRGFADVILEKLISVATDSGLLTLRLETGAHSTAAIRFYRRNGFKPCEMFEPYSSMPPDATSASVFMQKDL